MNNTTAYVIGVDYGTDSVRSVLLDRKGKQQAEAVFNYPRWKQGLYNNSSKNKFRHHPLDYREGLQSTLKEVVGQVSDEVVQQIKGISVDTTGSTPVAVDKLGKPLAMRDEFAENPNGMFVLWKDHTAVKEAGEITDFAKSWGGVDYTKYVGGIYSSEWFWAKMLHILRTDEQIREAAYSWVELCDWVPYELTGKNDVHEMKRSRCAAGHKAMWNEEFNGLPSQDFLTQLDSLLSDIRERLFRETYTSDQPAGTISKEWAQKTGLPENVVVGVGAFDAHMGAVGGEIEAGYLSRVMGTSTCDIMVAPYEEVHGNLVQGICGQVDGSVIPGMIGLEAGQSGFGDVYAWFKNIIIDTVEQSIRQSSVLLENKIDQLTKELDERLLNDLSQRASQLKVWEDDVISLDWLNGRRTPDANQRLKSAVMGLDLGSDGARFFKSLVESTCFGARAIVERFEDEGIAIEGVIGLGGVAKKSPFVMQTLANVLNMPIKIAKADQVCARGAAMFAATAAGIYDTVREASNGMGQGFGEIYHPETEKVPVYDKLYQKYLTLGNFVEEQTEKQVEEINV